MGYSHCYVLYAKWHQKHQRNLVPKFCLVLKLRFIRTVTVSASPKAECLHHLGPSGCGWPLRGQAVLLLNILYGSLCYPKKKNDPFLLKKTHALVNGLMKDH